MAGASRAIHNQASRLLLLTSLMVTPVFATAVEISDQLDVSGFARIIGGYLDSDADSLNGYEDELTFREQSLVAIQPSYTFSDQLSVTGQFLAHSNPERESGTEWLYVSYQPNSHWQFRAGKMRIPRYAYSDSIDVGYSYHWITPPLQVYNNYLVPTFNGVSANYNYAGEDFALYLEGFYGYFNGEIFQAGNRVDVKADVEDLRGIAATLSSHNISLRLSYNTGTNKTDVPQLVPLQNALELTGFNNSAHSLDGDGRAHFYEIALSYDNFDHFIKAEWTRAETELDLAPSVEGYYLTAGHLMNDWTLHFTYAASAYANVKAQQELQPFRNQPGHPLAELSNGYYQIFDSVPNGSLDSYTLGARWDFRLNMALKAEASYLHETQPRSGFFGTRFTTGVPEDLDKKLDATLLQVGWEWVF